MSDEWRVKYTLCWLRAGEHEIDSNRGARTSAVSNYAWRV
jgi:hypothetical protein